MFTGLIKEIGTVESICSTSKGLLYRIKSPSLHKELELGGSIAIDGMCQSVTKILSNGFEAIAGAATREKSTIQGSQNRWKRGRLVHLEPALSMGDSLDGHLVQGHIKGVVSLDGQVLRNKSYILRFRLPTPLLHKVLIENEDSVTIDGVSLTVSRAWGNLFEVNILPDTLARTNFRTKKRGDLCNYEPDFLKLSHGIKSEHSIKLDKNFKPEKKKIENLSLSRKELLKWGYV